MQTLGDTGYVIVPRWQQVEPIRSILTREQGGRALGEDGSRWSSAQGLPGTLQYLLCCAVCVLCWCPVLTPCLPRRVPLHRSQPPAVGSTPYIFQNIIFQCQEDPEVGLAAELQSQGALFTAPGPAAESSMGGSSSGGDGGVPTWMPIVAGVVAALLLSAAGVAFVLLRRRRRAAARLVPAGGAKVAATPTTPRGPKLNKMETGDLDHLHLVAAAAGSPTARCRNELAAGDGSDGGSSRQRPPTPEQQQGETNRRLQGALWRSRQDQRVAAAACYRIKIV